MILRLVEKLNAKPIGVAVVLVGSEVIEGRFHSNLDTIEVCFGNIDLKSKKVVIGLQDQHDATYCGTFNEDGLLT